MSHSPADIVQALTEQVRRIEGVKRLSVHEQVTSGCVELDHLLPQQAFRRGSLVEWLGASGGGATTLALVVARQALAQGGALVVIDTRQTFYPPAAAALGIALEKMIVVHPRCAADHAWAVDQVLRSAGVSAALAWPADWDDHTFRRLQLAAESSGVLGLLICDETLRTRSSWADVRLLVQPVSRASNLDSKQKHLPASWVPVVVDRSRASRGQRPPDTLNYSKRQMPSPQPSPQGRGSGNRQFHVEVLRVRGGAGGGHVEIELDEETGALYGTTAASSLRVAAELAAPAARHRSQGA